MPAAAAGTHGIQQATAVATMRKRAGRPSLFRIILLPPSARWKRRVRVCV